MTVARSFLVLGSICFLAGCQSAPQMVVVPSLRPSPPVAVTKSPKSNAPFGTVADVRQSEAVKVYGLNRYVDPADPRMMHERHAVYRVEQQSSWVTRSRSRQGQVLLGPILGLHRPEYTPEPLPGETARELTEAKRGLQDNNEDLRAMRDSQEKLASNVQLLAERTLDAQRKLTGAVAVLNERLKKLESQSMASPTPSVHTGAATRSDTDVLARSGE
jgi:small-conductance mechanosensitive channel